MRLHIVTVGEPKLSYAKAGWAEYTGRLAHYHKLKLSHIPDKHAYNPDYLRQITGTAFKIALVIDGRQFTSTELATLLQKHAEEAKEVCLMIGGPDGLPQETIQEADMQLGLSRLTFPHDLAMVVLAESLYRASTINAGHPYHR